MSNGKTTSRRSSAASGKRNGADLHTAVVPPYLRVKASFPPDGKGVVEDVFRAFNAQRLSALAPQAWPRAGVPHRIVMDNAELSVVAVAAQRMKRVIVELSIDECSNVIVGVKTRFAE